MDRPVVINVRSAERSDISSWLRMRTALWPDAEDEHAVEIERYFVGKARGADVVLLAEDQNGRVVGFAELSLRPFAEGCRTSRVAYLEGWYADPDMRGQGVGRALVESAEEWGRNQGCTELASDAEVDNEASMAAHVALGFRDAGVVRCFCKEL